MKKKLGKTLEIIFFVVAVGLVIYVGYSLTSG